MRFDSEKSKRIDLVNPQHSLVIFLSPYPAQEMYPEWVKCSRSRTSIFFSLTRIPHNDYHCKLRRWQYVGKYEHLILRSTIFTSKFSPFLYRLYSLIFFFLDATRASLPDRSLAFFFLPISRYPVVLASTLLRSLCSRISVFLFLPFCRLKEKCKQIGIQAQNTTTEYYYPATVRDRERKRMRSKKKKKIESFLHT